MKECKKVNDLVLKYPLLFTNPPFGEVSWKNSSVIHFTCGDGWYYILDSLLLNINHKLSRWREVCEIKQRMVARGEPVAEWISKFFEENKTDPLSVFRVDQVKEKFGGLRFYWDIDRELVSNESCAEITGAVGVAESMSFRVCEECGKPGKTENINGYLIATLCEEHMQAERDRLRGYYDGLSKE